AAERVPSMIFIATLLAPRALWRAPGSTLTRAFPNQWRRAPPAPLVASRLPRFPHRRQEMPFAVATLAEPADGGGGRGRFEGHALDHLDAIAGDPGDFLRIVGEEPDLFHAQLGEHLRAQAEVAERPAALRLDRVEDVRFERREERRAVARVDVKEDAH